MTYKDRKKERMRLVAYPLFLYLYVSALFKNALAFL